MNKYKGKKLLLLGSNVGTLDLLAYAKADGAYTIVADNLPLEKSIGKQYADSNAYISTGDFEQLKRFVRSEKIDGVFAGISEFNLLNALRICEEMSLPFYCTREQWDKIENKERFRHLCEQFRVPAPKTFYSGSDISCVDLEQIDLPVIVKPVDSCSSIGVSICREKEGLKAAMEEARAHSPGNSIIVEELFDGEEFTAHYTVVNHRVSLSCIDNRIPVCVHDGNVTSIPVARVYPSSFINEYLNQVNERMIDLCESLEMECGVLFVQGLYDKRKNRFAVFEAGLRCAGEAPYRFLEKINGVNFMRAMLDYSLLGRVDSFPLEKDDPYLKGRIACVTSFVSKGGVIAKIDGYDSIEKDVPSIIDKECRYQVGDCTPSGDTLRQIVLRFVLICDSQQQLINDVTRINRSVKVYDSDGNDLCHTFDISHYYTSRQ
ncbi:MAG: ATP-grasp domain-containing protein [Bacteroidales bacterium]|nr:ATP-grasp domain-containing protein [Bacteroidales bacterium]